ncbi:MAG: carboxypeptidase-like regulatory domain-containing protein [Planctomycetota bacterium]
MKFKSGFFGLAVFFVLQAFFLQNEAYPSLQKVNMGVYGAQVTDIAAYNNSGSSEILIAAESIKGVYKWTSGATSWQAVTYPAVVGKASQIEMNLASGYENDVYAIISDTSNIVMLYGSDSGGSSGSWSSIFSIMGPHLLHGHSTGMYVTTFDGKVYRSTGGVSDSFDLLYSFGAEVTSISAYNDKTFFAVTRSGSVTTLYNVTSSGGVFSATPLALPAISASAGAVEVHLVGVDPTNVNTLFLAGSSVNPQVYRSIDGGTSWSSSWDSNSTGANHFSGGYPQYIKFNNNRVFISAAVLDGTSTTWSVAPNFSSTLGTNTIETHVNSGSLEVDPVDSSIVYIGSDWGIGQTTYASGAWTTGSEIGNNDGIEGVVLNDMEFHEYTATHKELWVAAKSGVGRALNFNPLDSTTTDEPADWIFPIYPNGDGAPLTRTAIHPSDPTIVCLGNNGGKVYKTTNGTSTTLTGFAWTMVFDASTHTSVFGTNRPDHSTITAVRYVPSTPNRMYLSGYNLETKTDGGVFYSDDTGNTWTEDASITGTPVNCLWVSDSTAWAGVGNDVSTKKGLMARTSVIAAGNWWSPTTGLPLDTEIVKDINGTTIGGSTGTTTVYIATTGGVYKGVLSIPLSTGFSSWVWTSMTSAIGSTNTNFTAVSLDPNNADTAYAAVGNCIYETTDGGTSWAVFSTSCSSTHEDVNVLKFDDIMAGTAMGLFSFTEKSDAKGKISGRVVGTGNKPIPSAEVSIKGVKTEFTSAIESKDNGSFTFSGLEADTYYITAMKNGYKPSTQKVKLKKDEVKKDVQIKLKKKKK